LALAIEERSAEPVIAFVTDRRTGVPELRRADLVGDVLDLVGDRAVLDLEEQLAAELGVVTLLVDREGAIADDVDAVLDVGDHVGDAERRLARLQRDVGHALELDAGPAVGVAAAVRRRLALDMGLVADRLIADQLAVADQIPLLGGHAFVIIGDGAQAADLRLVGDDVDPLAAVL